MMNQKFQNKPDQDNSESPTQENPEGLWNNEGLTNNLKLHEDVNAFLDTDGHKELFEKILLFNVTGICEETIRIFLAHKKNGNCKQILYSLAERSNYIKILEKIVSTKNILGLKQQCILSPNDHMLFPIYDSDFKFFVGLATFFLHKESFETRVCVAFAINNISNTQLQVDTFIKENGKKIPYAH